MATKPKLREGSPTAEEIYYAVGLALSWWESSEDIIDSLFKAVCWDKEPTAVETFLVAPREARQKMVLSAMNRYQDRVERAEVETVEGALKALEKLARGRNQIAHGYVSNVSMTVDDELTMIGNFLTSSFNRSGAKGARSWNYKFALTAEDIIGWKEAVRAERAKIMDVSRDIMVRAQSKPDP